MKTVSGLLLISAGIFFAVFSRAADFNGDGTDDIAIARPTPGPLLWAVRGVTRAYYGSGSDIPVPGDYNGNGTDSIAVVRPTPGLWAIRGVTRAYFGGAGDTPIGGSGGGGSSLWKSGAYGDVYTMSDVGIGTSSPWASLHVQANQSESIILGVGATSRAAQLVLNRGGANDTFIGPSAGNQFDLVTREDIPIVIGNSLTERMRIDIDGDVGIGTSYPTSKLHIKDSVSAVIRVESSSGTKSGLSMFRPGDTQSRALVYLKEDNDLGLAVGDGTGSLTEMITITRNNGGRVGILTGGLTNYTLEVNGTAGKSGGGTWADSCDERLKKDIKPLDGKEALDALCRLRGVTFEWVNPEEHAEGVHAGVIAQNVEEVFPEWVVEIDARGRDKELFPAGTKAKAVSLPHGFNAYIIESIKELRSENEQLEKRLEVLEERMK